MKRIALFLALCVSAGPAWAQGGMMPGPGTVHSIPPSYVGPGDVVTTGWTSWVGLRGFSGAVAATGTQKSVNIIRASDSHTCDVLIATTGDLGNTTSCSTGGDNGQSASSFCTSTTCKIVTAYDQTGNGRDKTQATGANQPGLIFTGCTSGSLPCITNTANTQLLVGPNTGGSATGTVAFVAVRTGDLGNFDHFSDGNIFQGIYWAAANNLVLRCGFDMALSPTDGTWYSVLGTASVTDSAYNINGTDTPQSNCAWSGVVGSPTLGSFVGKYVEQGETTTQPNSTNRSTLTSNAKTYWGF